MGLVSSFDLHGSSGALALKLLDADQPPEVDQNPRRIAFNGELR